MLGARGRAILAAVAREFEVLVVGGGVAGAAAALAATARGRRVVLVRVAPGATAQSSGVWRGPLPPPMREALASAGLPHAPCAAPLPHPTGELRAADHAAPLQREAVVEGGTLVLDIEGLPGFHAPGLARLWSAAGAARVESGSIAAGAETPAGGWSPVSLAGQLQRNPEPLGRTLADAVRRASARRVILPAVLGFDDWARVRAALVEMAGVPVAEMLGVPPSLPGWRLDAALLRALDRAGVEVVTGRVTERVLSGRRVVAVRVTTGRARPDRAHTAPGATPDGEPMTLHAREFVLATGKFAAGGVVAALGAPFVEPALHCPIRVEHLGEVFEAADPLALTHRERTLPQPLLRVGVATDADGRPVDGRGDVVYENVRVAGSIRAGVDAAALGLGDAAEDGARAGESAAEAA